MIKAGDGQLKPFTERIYLDQICESLIKCGANPYILTLEDFPLIPYILAEASGVLLYPGSDLPSSYYGEKNRFCLTHRDSHSTYLFNQALMDQAPKEMPVLGICYGS